ncbi:uncharacterized protein LOC113363765 [Ctenocephalides felis]|uniref:uncharacterized protein LOC113363765 n=1 Tax=Ctenocephalides felis TaxID=7515 RepID=UPI000E6E2AFA|nr:uncharacterized protein LOC113363765 [Ctenocephalides felis]
MNLNLVFIIGCLICGTLVSAQGSSEITRLLGNQQIVGKQIMCVLDKGPCDQLGNQLKAALPEVLTRNCRSCNPQQAANAQKLIRFLQAHYPEVWSILTKKYKS